MIRALIIGVVIGMALCSGKVHAEPVEFDCSAIAQGMALMADFRDTGANVDAVVKLARRRNSDATPAHKAVIEREIRRVWREQLDRDAAVLNVYKRCRAQQGDMGMES